MQVGVGYSQHRSPAVAAQEATKAALTTLKTERPDLVIVFNEPGYAPDIIVKTVREMTQGAPLCGGSMEGLITREVVDESNFGVVVTAIKSEALRFHVGSARGLEADSEGVGRELGRALRGHYGESTLCAFTLVDGLKANVDRYSNGLLAGIGASKPLPILGGLTADAWQFKQTHQYADDAVFSDGAVGVLVSGDMRLAYGVGHGCVPIGNTRRITRAEKNIVYEVDGKPAIDFVREYIDLDEGTDWQKASVNFVLAFPAPGYMAGNYDSHIIRFMVARNADGSITLQSDVPDSAVCLARRDVEKMRAANQALAKNLHQQLGGRRPKFALHLDCAGRGRLILSEQERRNLVRELQAAIDPAVPWTGAYVFGELAPVNGRNTFHNYTSVVALFH